MFDEKPMKCFRYLIYVSMSPPPPTTRLQMITRAKLDRDRKYGSGQDAFIIIRLQTQQSKEWSHVEACLAEYKELWCRLKSITNCFIFCIFAHNRETFDFPEIKRTNMYIHSLAQNW